ncbi:MAG: hypothetical protein NT031_20925, partial [Planctomycetota bacterium]|nr:hypothetical protein [Planctomycetota bacterium]
MKATIVALAGLILWGCERPAAGRPAPKAAEVSKQERYHIENPDLTGPLCRSLKVRKEADSWAQLVAKVKPTFTWTAIDEIVPTQGRPAWVGRDMLWIEIGADKQPVFRVERAFTWKPAGLKPRWVLLDYHDERPDPGFEEQVMGKPWALQKALMKAMPRGDTASDYVILKGRHDRGGAVYEICWVKMTYAGMGHVTEVRFLLVWQDTRGVWRFIGEGPMATEEKHGAVWVKFDLRWQGDPSVPVVTYTVTWAEWALLDNGEEAVDGTTYRDGIIDPPVGGVTQPFRWLNDLVYMLAEKDETIEKMTYRRAFWQPGWGGGKTTSGPELLRIRETMLREWRAKILQLNPELVKVGAGPIPEGTRV